MIYQRVNNKTRKSDQPREDSKKDSKVFAKKTGIKGGNEHDLVSRI